MKTNILNEKTGELISLEINEETTAEILKSLVEIEFNIEDSSKLELVFEGKILESNSVISKIVKLDSIIVASIDSKPNLNTYNNHFSPDTWMRIFSAQLFDKIKKDNSLRLIYESKCREFKEAIDRDDLEMFSEILKRECFSKIPYTNSNLNIPSISNLDPLSPEYQILIEEQVKRQNINDTLSLAQDHLPESFAQVHMLYINIEVNGNLIKAFVDSGAQTTIMSKKCAERCNLVRLIDDRFQGIAQGIGTSKIFGRIHLAQMRIGNSFFPFSITVIEGDGVDFLFGLDLLRRYQCCIDLLNNVLIIGNEKVPFLSESELKNETNGSDVRYKSEGEEVDEEKIAKLVSLGFPEIEAKNALLATNGNLELAASLLFPNENRN